MTEQTKTINRRNMFKLGLIGGLAAIVGCGASPEKTIRYPVEDVLANYDGWSVIYTDKNTNEVIEKRLYNGGRSSVKVYKDLNENQERYAEINFCDECLDPITNPRVKYSATIHLRKQDKIYGGFDSNGEKQAIRQYPRRQAVELGEKQ